MSPFSCQAKRGIKYFPSRVARQQAADRWAKERAGRKRQGQAGGQACGSRTENRKTIASNREPLAFPFYFCSLSFAWAHTPPPLHPAVAATSPFSPSSFNRIRFLVRADVGPVEPKLQPRDSVSTSHAKCNHTSCHDFAISFLQFFVLEE